MANTKKRNDSEVEVTENVTSTEEIAVDATEKEINKTTPKKAPRKFAPNDLIECKSVTYGELLLPGLKSQLLYTWADFGDVTEVEFQDLQALRSRNSQYLKAPMFVIEDKELLAQWGDLAALYTKIATTDINSLFSLPTNKFKIALQNMPKGFREAVKNMASSKILDGSLDSIQKIKAIDEILGTDLMFYIQ